MSDFLQKINWIDLLAVILLVRSSYVGFTKGFGWEFFRFLGYLGGAFLSVYYYEYVSQLTGDYLPAVSPFSNLISFTSIYILILFIFKFINTIIEKIIKIEIFSTLERLGGLILGFLRGAITLSLILITLVLMPVPYFEKSVKERSYTGPTILMVVPFLYERAAKIFPALKFERRNEALSKVTGLDDWPAALKRMRGN